MGAGVFGMAAPADEDSLTQSSGYVGVKIGFMQLVETKTFAVATNAVDFSATLAGNTDGHYRIVARINDVSAVSELYLRLNGGAGAGTSQRLDCDGVGVSTDNAANLRVGVCYNGVSGALLIIDVVTIDGVNKQYFSNCRGGHVNNILDSFVGNITTPNSSTEITSLGIGCSNNMTAGTMYLYKLWT